MKSLAVLALLVAAAAAVAQESWNVEISATQAAIHGTPVSVPLPEAARGAKALRLVGAREIPVQVRDGAASWILEADLAAGAKRAYRLESSAPAASPSVEVKDVEARHLLFRVAGKDAFRYNHAVVEAPAGVDPVFNRSGYLHPIWSPGGRVVTNDFPAKHLHHHGLWFPWTSSEFEGRKSDFWNSIEKQGKVECVKVDETFSGPVFGGFRARHRFVNLNAPEGPKAALDEVWEVRLYNLADRFVFDLVSTQTCATNAPLVIREYRYGGLGFRGSAQWEGKDGAAFLTSEGKGRVDGHATRANWCVMSGKIDGQDAFVGFLGHPSNFRHPQPMRIHPDEPFFNWAPCQAGDFSIEPGQPYVSAYRFVISSAPLPKDEMDRLFSSFSAFPPRK
jgi:hypothetical protein